MNDKTQTFVTATVTNNHALAHRTIYARGGQRMIPPKGSLTDEFSLAELDSAEERLIGNGIREFTINRHERGHGPGGTGAGPMDRDGDGKPGGAPAGGNKQNDPPNFARLKKDDIAAFIGERDGEVPDVDKYSKEELIAVAQGERTFAAIDAEKAAEKEGE